jgi:hypothetical protein
MNNEQREFLDQMTIDDIKLVEATKKAGERIHAGIVDHHRHVAAEGQITPSEATRRQVIEAGTKPQPLSDLDQYILDDMKFIAQHTGYADFISALEVPKAPVVIPAENTKPKLERSPKKRSPRLSSEQKRRNRARRARDERRAKRAISVDVRLPVDDAVAVENQTPNDAVLFHCYTDGNQKTNSNNDNMPANYEVHPNYKSCTISHEKSFLEKRLDSALQRDAKRHEEIK